MCTTAQYADDDKIQPQRRQQMPQQLQEDLLLQKETDNCNLLILNDYNPISLEEKIDALDPTIFWLVDDNAFRLRYYLRTSGLDGILNYKCGSSSSSSDGGENTTLNCLYIGENAGAVVAGASLATTAHAMHHHHGPKEAAPEPQYFGLGLLGPDRSVYYHDDENSSSSSQEQQQQNENDLSSIIALKHDQIYVWSQLAAKEEMTTTTTTTSSATSFIFLPSQRGAVEHWQSLPPVPPLVRLPNDDDGGVACHGEPSIDPSRVIQNGMGDSEWITEVEDATIS